MDRKIIKPETEEKIFSYWENYNAGTDEEVVKVLEHFQPYISAINITAAGRYFWEIYSINNPRILAADGDIEYLTPYTKNSIHNITPRELLNDYHPDDKKAMFSFILKLVELLHQKKIDKRNDIRATMYARFKRKNGGYEWVAVEYTSFLFAKNGNAAFGLVVYFDISQIAPAKMRPMMIIKEITKNKTEFTKYSTSEAPESVEKFPSLTKREQQIVKLLLQGKASKQIAGELGITKRTVDNFRQGLFKKFQATGTVDLIAKLTGINDFSF